MRATLERTGGFAGVRLTSTVDTDDLPDADAKRLRQLVASANFFSLPATLRPDRPQPDRFQFKVTVEDGGRRHCVKADETACPPALRLLTDFLARRARRG